MGVGTEDAATWLAGASIDEEIFLLCPDYVAGIAVATGLAGGESSEASEELLVQAEDHAAQPGVAESSAILAWREAYRSFGEKPKRARSSLDALTRRAAKDALPRINRLTDVYNAVSVLQAVPIGAEDVDCYQGPLRLVRAEGDEEFLTRRDGEEVNDPPKEREPVWRDDLGITCRRWNWRQTSRTALTPDSTNVVFIVDALGPDAQERAEATLEALRTHLLSDGGTWQQRLLAENGLSQP